MGRMERVVPEYAVERLRERVAKLARKAVRAGVPPPVLTVGEPYYVDTQATPDAVDPLAGGAVNFGAQTKVVDVVVEAEEIKLAGGYRLLGALDFIEGNVLVRPVPGEEVPPEYRETGAQCDYCKTERYRRNVYVVANADGGTMQVGGNCISVVLGVDPAQLTAQMRVWGELGGALDDNDCADGGGATLRATGYPVNQVLAAAVGVERNYGWLSVEKAREWDKASGASTLRAYLGCRTQKELHALFPEWVADYEADAALAEVIRDYALELPGESDYAYNVRTVAAAQYVDYRYLGVLGSVVAVWKRNQAEAAQAKEPFVNEPLAPVGKRLEFDATLLFERTFDGNYGPTFLQVYRAATGQRVTWFASRDAKSLGIEAGVPVRLKATVKKTQERDGVLETQVSRAAVVAA